MTDRIPGAPGQFKAVVTEAELLKMQSGEEFTITMTRDDQPIVEGTPYSKAAVLPDTLAQSLCPEVADPTPADALAALLPKSGGTMTGDVNMGQHAITGVSSLNCGSITPGFINSAKIQAFENGSGDDASFIISRSGNCAYLFVCKSKHGICAYIVEVSSGTTSVKEYLLGGTENVGMGFSCPNTTSLKVTVGGYAVGFYICADNWYV